MISKNGFGFYMIVSLGLLITCGPSGPFLSYFIAFGASSIGLIIQSGERQNANN